MTEKTMRLEYRLRDDVDVAAYLPRLASFASSLRAEPACRSYQPYQAAAEARRFVHVGVFAGDTSAFQAAPWFQEFTAWLRARTVAPPEVVWLTPAA